MRLHFVPTLLILALASSSAFAAGGPKGKPFVAINEQIIEVEGAVSSLDDQADLLVERVETLEEQVGANANAIVLLQEQNDALEVLLQQGLSDIAQIQTEIDLLQTANAELIIDIETLTGDTAILEAELAENKAMIATLQSAILMVENQVISLDLSLQGQIDHNLDLIGVIQGELDIINDMLALKQGLIDGYCPDGTVVQQIRDDGSVLCQETFSGGGSAGQLVTSFAIKPLALQANENSSTKLFCPAGFLATSAGYLSSGRFKVLNTYARDDFAWLSAKNNGLHEEVIYVTVTCMSIAP